MIKAPVTRNGERGFALLFVFLMAAIVGLYLYTQLPRVAFESERDKEQLLIDRGEQYKRAIQLYVQANKTWPQKIEDLENTNDKRYLRQRYVDPMTGTKEWRLIHVNAGGVLTDSLVKPLAAGTGPNGQAPNGMQTTSTGTGFGTSSGTSTMAMAGTPGTASPTGTPGVPDPNAPPPDPNDVNAAVKRRPSDVVGQAYTAPANVDPNDPSTWAPISLSPVNANGGPTGQPPSGAVGFNGGLLGQMPNQIAGQMQGQAGYPPQPNIPGQMGGTGVPLPGQPGFNPLQNQFKIDSNGQLVPVTPTQTGAVINSQTGGVQGVPTDPTQQTGVGSGINAPGMNPAGNGVAAQNAATSAITQMLTNPLGSQNGLGQSAGMSQGGIAGVASTYKGTSIKEYATRKKYQEWEFVFSQNNQQGTNGQTNPLQPGQNGLQPGQTNPTGVPGQNGTGFMMPTPANPGSPTGTGNQ
jgi:hypothetical protein